MLYIFYYYAMSVSHSSDFYVFTMFLFCALKTHGNIYVIHEL